MSVYKIQHLSTEKKIFWSTMLHKWSFFHIHFNVCPPLCMPMTRDIKIFLWLLLQLQTLGKYSRTQLGTHISKLFLFHLTTPVFISRYNWLVFLKNSLFPFESFTHAEISVPTLYREPRFQYLIRKICDIHFYCRTLREKKMVGCFNALIW